MIPEELKEFLEQLIANNQQFRPPGEESVHIQSLDCPNGEVLEIVRHKVTHFDLLRQRWVTEKNEKPLVLACSHAVEKVTEVFFDELMGFPVCKICIEKCTNCRLQVARWNLAPNSTECVRCDYEGNTPWIVKWWQGYEKSD